MKFRILEIFLGAFLAVAIFAMGILFSSQYPGQATQTNSAAKPNQPTSNKGKPEGFWEGVATDPVAAFTLGLVLVGAFQVGLFYVQLRLIKETLAPAKEAADAAKLNAEAVIKAERAYLFVEICLENVVDIIKYMQGMQSVAPRPILIQYRFTNYGKTPAVIKSISYGAVVAENLPRQREYIHILHLPTHLLGAETSTKTLEYDEFKISAAIADSIQNLTDTFWFYGEIVYDDMFERQNTFDFVFHVSGISEGFTLYQYKETDEKRKS